MSNEQIQRYHCIQDRIDGQMNPQDDGNWILYTDHLAATTELREGQMHLAMELEAKDEQIRKLREALEELVKHEGPITVSVGCSSDSPRFPEGFSRLRWDKARAALKAGE